MLFSLQRRRNGIRKAGEARFWDKESGKFSISRNGDVINYIREDGSKTKLDNVCEK